MNGDSEDYTVWKNDMNGLPHILNGNIAHAAFEGERGISKNDLPVGTVVRGLAE